MTSGQQLVLWGTTGSLIAWYKRCWVLSPGFCSLAHLTLRALGVGELALPCWCSCCLLSVNNKLSCSDPLSLIIDFRQMPCVSFGVLLLFVIPNEAGVLLWQMISTKSIKQASPKWKWCPAVYVSGDESKVWRCKEQYWIGTWNLRFINQSKLEVVKQEMVRKNIDILGISELKWTRMGEFNSDAHCIYYCGQQSLKRKGRGTKRSNCQHPLDHRKSKRIPEKHLLLLHSLR